MPEIVTSPWAAQSLALTNTQIEFEHNRRSISESRNRDRTLVYIAGVHQDTIRIREEVFSPTFFVPWAAYIQQRDGRELILEQHELVKQLKAFSVANRDQIDLEVALRELDQRGRLRLVASDRHSQ